MSLSAEWQEGENGVFKKRSIGLSGQQIFEECIPRNGFRSRNELFPEINGQTVLRSWEGHIRDDRDGMQVAFDELAIQLEPTIYFSDRRANSVIKLVADSSSKDSGRPLVLVFKKQRELDALIENPGSYLVLYPDFDFRLMLWERSQTNIHTFIQPDQAIALGSRLDPANLWQDDLLPLLDIVIGTDEEEEIKGGISKSIRNYLQDITEKVDDEGLKKAEAVIDSLMAHIKDSFKGDRNSLEDKIIKGAFREYMLQNYLIVECEEEGYYAENIGEDKNTLVNHFLKGYADMYGMILDDIDPVYRPRFLHSGIEISDFKETIFRWRKFQAGTASSIIIDLYGLSDSFYDHQYRDLLGVDESQVTVDKQGDKVEVDVLIPQGSERWTAKFSLASNMAFSSLLDLLSNPALDPRPFISLLECEASFNK